MVRSAWIALVEQPKLNSAHRRSAPNGWQLTIPATMCSFTEKNRGDWGLAPSSP